MEASVQVTPFPRKVYHQGDHDGQMLVYVYICGKPQVNASAELSEVRHNQLFAWARLKGLLRIVV